LLGKKTELVNQIQPFLSKGKNSRKNCYKSHKRKSTQLTICLGKLLNFIEFVNKTEPFLNKIRENCGV